MKVDYGFTVGAPVDRAWKTMLDPERIPPCPPGPEIPKEDDGEYAGTMGAKIGPTNVVYKGTVRLEGTDGANRR